MPLSGMKNELYTVRQVARMASVGIKTLHHYDAIGLLRPLALSAAGYRLYGRAQLERLQQVLYYRELGFPLKDIHDLLSSPDGRLDRLRYQRTLLLQKHADVARLIATLDRTIAGAEGETNMPDHALFDGFRSEPEWNRAMAEHNADLKAHYNADISPVTDAAAMNDAASMAKLFMSAMRDALLAGQAVTSEDVSTLVGDHVAWLIAHGHAKGSGDFVAQTWFFIQDDFHRNMLESQQPGLSHYMNAAARVFASQEKAPAEQRAP